MAGHYEAPAKLNLSLLVQPPRSDGMHPLESLVQTVSWIDSLQVDESEDGEDHLLVEPSDLEVEDNLVLQAIRAVRRHIPVPPLSLRLGKVIPMAAGLGGGSADAAASLVAAAEAAGAGSGLVTEIAPTVGADVPLFLIGGTLSMSGIGETLRPLQPLEGFALGIVVPEFGLSTKAVYRRWDEMEGPAGEPAPEWSLPPALRDGMPMRNDLLPAALSLEPQLGDFMADVRSRWGTTVCLTGSGSGCFGYFPTLAEAEDAVRDIPGLAASKGVSLRPRGVSRI